MLHSFYRRRFCISATRRREIYLLSNGLGITHAKRRRVDALETFPSNLPNVQSCCAYFVDNQSSSCEIILSQLGERKTCQQFLHALSRYIVVLAVRHANRRRVVALETLPSVQSSECPILCCVYFVDNQSSSCEIIVSQLGERTTCL